jgi:hypothetical protein
MNYTSITILILKINKFLMKKLLLTTSLLLITVVSLAQNTKEAKESKLEFVATGKLGWAKINQSGFVPLNANSNAGDLLLSYKLGKNWGLSSGVSFMELNTNLTQNGATASLQNSYLQIPLKIGGDYVMFNTDQSNSKIFLNVGAGFYASTLLKSELQTISGSTTSKNLGWNYGIVFNTGIKFLISDKTSIGIGFESQGDISKMKKDGVERKVEQLNSIYFSFGFKF